MNTRDTRRAIHREVAGKLVSRIVRIRASFRTVVEAAKLPRSRAPPPLPFPRILPFRRPLEKSNPIRLLIISFPERKGGERKGKKNNEIPSLKRYTRSHLPADVPRLRPLLQQRAVGAHLEHLPKTLELGPVREKLAIPVHALVQRLEERKREYLSRGPINGRVHDHYRPSRVSVSTLPPAHPGGRERDRSRGKREEGRVLKRYC